MKKNSTPVYVIRLKPGDDLKESIEKFVKGKNIEAGWVISSVGSLTRYAIRFANKQDESTAEGHFEIISLTGTVSVNGCHLHIGISDSSGKMTGGHLVNGCRIYTTAEIVLQCTSQFIFTREMDGTTPWKELQVKEK